MFQLTDRCSLLRERAVDHKQGQNAYIGQRIYHYLKGYYMLPEERRSNIMLSASSLASVIRNMEPSITNGELIVGYNYSDGPLASNTEEYFNMVGALQEHEYLRNYLRKGKLSDEQIEWVMSVFADSSDSFRYPYHFYNDEDPIQLSANERDLADGREAASIGFCLTHNHTILGYERVLRLGFAGILKEVQVQQAKNDTLTQSQQDFYDALEIVCSACCEIGNRYAREAEKMLQTCNEIDKQGLLAIKQTCERMPAQPASTFHEAVQSLWFAHIINTWEDGINANSLGRLDQILYPYYKKDIGEGRLTKEEAFELICCLWLKLYRDYDVQQSTVGGCDAEGNSMVNELSNMMLDATEALNFVRCLSVRFSKNTDRKFIMKALKVVGHVQKGIPFFFNDDVIIKALSSHGIPKKDASDYAAIGCVEIAIPGKSNSHAVTAQCNLLKAIEYTLNDGNSMFNPDLCPGVQTGDPLAFVTFEQLKSAVFKQMKQIIETSCKLTKIAVPEAGHNYPLPYKSLLTQGCLESCLDFNDKGPLYNYYQVMLFGIPNLADSLAAIEKLVYNEKCYTIGELIMHLKNNFPNEAVRRDFLNKAPKYGNDIPEVDNLAAEIMGYACDILDQFSKTSGLNFHAQAFTFLWMIDRGSTTAATPDGRRSGEILAYSMSPMQGRDFNGFTALINSLSGLPTEKVPGTTSSIVEVDPFLFTDKNIGFFADILLTAAAKGLSNIQFNTVDADTLLAAQKEPDKYRNLAVRVSGFSQKFNLLDKNLQDHIINRTKHRCL